MRNVRIKPIFLFDHKETDKTMEDYIKNVTYDSIELMAGYLSVIKKVNAMDSFCAYDWNYLFNRSFLTHLNQSFLSTITDQCQVTFPMFTIFFLIRAENLYSQTNSDTQILK